LSKKSKVISIFDTTLRDGEQTPGISLTPEDKIEIAHKLDSLGVDTIEAGFPLVSKGEYEAVKRITKEKLRSEICGLARANRMDIDKAIECDVDCVHTFIATSDIHMKYKLKMSKEEVLKAAVDSVEYAKKHGVVVEFSPEDASRTDFSYLMKVLKAVTDAKTDRINIPDTVGVMDPRNVYDWISKITDSIKIPISIHCHNDFGLAVANSLTAVEAGATQVHATINGLGERAGNASLEEIVMGIQLLLNKKTNINTKLLYETSKLVTRLTGISVQPNKAIVGENAFGHEAGIHTHGISAKPITYEPISPELVGRKRWFQAGKHAGTHGLKAKLAEAGLDADDTHMKEILGRVKEIGDKGKIVTDIDLISIARAVIEGLSDEEKILNLKNLSVLSGMNTVPTASVKLLLDGKEHIASATGVGPVDSAIKAIQKIISPLANVRLKEYRLEAITGGSDALAEVLIKVENGQGNFVSASAAREDVVMASVEAMIEGINKILARKKRK